MQQEKPDRSLGDLFGDLSRETGELLRKEVQLAKTELTQKAGRLGGEIGSVVAGGAIAYAGFLALLAALIIGLSQLGLSWWLAALIVGLVVAVIGYVFLQKGLKSLKRENLVPQNTVETVKEDVEWTKRQLG